MSGSDLTERSESLVEKPMHPSFGTFRYRTDTHRLTWSTELFEIFGFAEGEVVPSFALMATHQHPDDRAGWEVAIETILADGRPTSRWHRIIDAGSRVRTLQTSLDALPGPDDGRDTAGGGDTDGPSSSRVLEVRGILTDLTEHLRRDRSKEVAEAVARSAQTRAVIDQAKGVLMATMDLDEDRAFELLRWHSSRSNIKLRELAAAVLAQLSDPETAGQPPRQRLSTVLAGLGGERRPAFAPQRVGASVRPDPPVDQVESVSSLIPAELVATTLVRAVDAAGISISIADCLAPDWPLVYVNAAFESLTGYPSRDILGRNCRFLQGDQPDPVRAAAIRKALVAGDEVRIVLRNYRQDGTAFWNELLLSAVRDGTGRVTHYIGYQSDVSERVDRDAQLEQLGFRDAATGLPNSAALLEHLDRRIAAADQMTILHIRMSGHERPTGTNGDAHLRNLVSAAGERLGAALMTSAFLARVEDDAFVAVLPGVHLDGDKTLAAAFDEPFGTPDGTVRLRITVGAARHPRDGGHAEELIETARSAGTRAGG